MYLLSLEWNRVGVMDSDSGDDWTLQTSDKSGKVYWSYH